MYYDLVIHVDDNDPARLNLAFNNVANYKAALPGERAARLCFCSSKQKIPTEKIDRDLVWLLYSENGKAGQERSDSSCNLTRAQAARTNVYMGGSAVDDSLNASDIGLPSSVCSSVRMVDLDA